MTHTQSHENDTQTDHMQFPMPISSHFSIYCQKCQIYTNTRL